ncbi:ESPR-type extended signal peptide-containing protein [Basilea psittacipulmonis]|uniref:Uncharacterized protein n=1 Tax=Basilea psittacipulmonis DSM 24701 TaxID=1072685 RepID=A0A077DFI9_9BURK|nr:ESPR-type extended signal peptide-containing protein [Basilea psittacipulmonis]AIL32931.1 hypothetical protein IX83_06035 [Basilea psittacipulmonis DSM 24701]
MNKIYKTKFSKERNATVVVSELVSNHGKSSEKTSGIFGDILGMRKFKLSLFTLLLLSVTPSSYAALTISRGSVSDNCSYDDNRQSVALNPTNYDHTVACNAVGSQSVVIGNNAQGNKLGSIAYGANAQANLGNAIAIGYGANANVKPGSTSTDGGSIAVGSFARADYQGVVFGQNSGAGEQSVALGAEVYASGASAIAIGSDDLGADAGGYTDALSPNMVSLLKSRIPDYLLTNVASSVGQTVSAYFDTSYTNARQYSPTVSSGMGSIALGGRSIALSDASTAVGPLAMAFSQGATAFGLRSFVSDTAVGGTAVGNASRVFASNTVAIGNATEASELGAITYGYSSTASATNAVALGTRAYSGVRIASTNEHLQSLKKSLMAASEINAQSLLTDSALDKIASASSQLTPVDFVKDSKVYLTVGGVDIKKTLGAQDDSGNMVKNTLAIGSYTLALKNNAMSLGYSTFANANNSLAIGSYAYVTDVATNGMSIGVASYVDGVNGMALGAVSRAKANNAMALGYASLASGENALAIGVGANSTAESSFVIGQGAVASRVASMAIGNNTQSDLENSIALGYRSTTNYFYSGKADERTATTTGTSAFGLSPYVPKGSNYAVATNANDGIVSVGGWVNENGQIGTRRIVNVAPGALDSDAATVGQLKALEYAASNPSMRYYVETSGQKVLVKFDYGTQKFHAVNPRTGEPIVEGQAFDISQVKVGAFDESNRQAYTDATVTNNVNSETLGNSLVVGNVAAGRIADDSEDAINGSQLKALADKIGLTYDSTTVQFALPTQTYALKNSLGKEENTSNQPVTLVQNLIHAMNRGLMLKGNEGGATLYFGSTVNLLASDLDGTYKGKNLKTVIDNNGVLRVALSDRPVFSQVTVDDVTLSSNDTGLTLASSSMPANGVLLTGVSDGVISNTSTDAILLHQLTDRYSKQLHVTAEAVDENGQKSVSSGSFNLKDNVLIFKSTDDVATKVKGQSVVLSLNDEFKQKLDRLPDLPATDKVNRHLSNLDNEGQASDKIASLAKNAVKWYVGADDAQQATPATISHGGRIDFVSGDDNTDVKVEQGTEEIIVSIATKGVPMRYVGLNANGTDATTLNYANNGATGDQAIAIGANAKATAAHAIALGSNSHAVLENTVSLGNDSQLRQLIHVAGASEDTDAVNVSQLKALSQRLADVIGGGTTVNEDGSLKVGSLDAEGAATDLTTALNHAQTAANKKNSLKSGDSLITVTQTGDDFNVSDKNWSGEINQSKTALVAELANQPLSYQAKGDASAKTVTLNQGLDFTVGDQNLNVIAQANGQVRYDLGSTISGVKKIVLADSQEATADDYATGNNATQAVTESEVKSLLDQTNQAWVLAGKDSAAATVKSNIGLDDKVTFKAGTGLTVGMSQDPTSKDTTLTYQLKQATLKNEHNQLALDSGDSDGFVTGTNYTNVINEIIQNIVTEGKAGTQTAVQDYAQIDASNIETAKWQAALGGFKFADQNGTTIERKLGTTLTVKGGQTDASQLTSNNIGVEASGQQLSLKLAKDITGLSSVKTIAAQVGDVNLTVNGDSLKLGNDDSPVKLTNVARGKKDTDAATVADLGNQLSKLSQALGQGSTYDGTNGTVTLENYANVPNARNVEEAIAKTYELAKVKTKVEAGNEYVTVSQEGNTYTVSGRDWSSDIQNAAKDTVSNLTTTATLAYSDGTNAYTTTLDKGLSFAGDQNITASVAADGQVTLSLNKNLTGISSISGLDTTRQAGTTENYGVAGNEQRVATESAVKALSDQVNVTGWSLSSNTEGHSSIAVTSGKTVKFIDGKGTQANVNVTDGSASVNIALKQNELTVTDSTVTASNTETASDSFVTAQQIAKAVNKAVGNASQGLSDRVSHLILNTAGDDHTTGQVSLTRDVFGFVTKDAEYLNLKTKAESDGVITIDLVDSVKEKLQAVNGHADELLAGKADKDATSVTDVNRQTWQTAVGALNFAGDSGAIDRHLGSSLTVRGAYTGTTEDLSDNNIAVTASAQQLEVKLASRLTGLTSVQTETAQIGNVKLSTGDNATTLKLSSATDSSAVTLNGVAAGSADQEAVNYAQLTQLADEVAQVLGEGATASNGTVTIKDFAGVEGATTIQQALETIGQTATDSRVQVTAGDHITVTPSTDRLTYLVAGKNWQSEVDKIADETKSSFESASLSYTANGVQPAKTTTLSQGLSFQSGNDNLVAKIQDDGSITYQLATHLTGIDKITGLDTTRKAGADGYGSNTKVATEAALADLEKTISGGWIATSSQGQATVTPGDTVTFKNGIGTLATVNYGGENGESTVAMFGVRGATLSVDKDSKVTATTSSTLPSNAHYVNAGEVAKAINEAIVALGLVVIEKEDHEGSDAPKTTVQVKDAPLKYQGNSQTGGSISLKSGTLSILGTEGQIETVSREDGTVEIKLSDALKAKLESLPTDTNHALSEKADKDASNIDPNAWNNQLGGITFTDDSGQAMVRKLGETLNIQGGSPSTDLSEGNIGVTAKENLLTIQLSKNLKGLKRVEAEKVNLGDTTSTVSLSSDGHQLTLGTVGTPVRIQNLAEGTGANDAVTKAQVDRLANSVNDVLGISSDASNIGGTGKSSVPEAIGKVYDLASKQVKVKSSNKAMTTVSPDLDSETEPSDLTYTVAAVKDWQSVIDKQKTNITQQFLTANLHYKAASGSDQQTTLTQGLTFKDGKNMTATVDDNGQVTFALNKTLSGVSSITGLDTTVTPNSNMYASGNAAKQAATESAVLSAYQLANAGWYISANGTTQNVASGHTVTFKGENGLTAAVTMNNDDANVTYTLTSATLGNNTSSSDVELSSGQADGFVTAENVEEVVNAAIAAQTSQSATETTEKLKSYANVDADNIDVSKWQDALGSLTFKDDIGATQALSLGGNTLRLQGGVSNEANLTSNNIGVIKGDENTIKIQLAKSLTGLDTVTSQQVTVGGSDGIVLSNPANATLKVADASGNGVRITNIQAGEDDNDAATYVDFKPLEELVGTGKSTSQGASASSQDGLDGASDLGSQIVALRNGTAGVIVYTNEAGERLVVNNGQFYKASDIENGSVKPNATAVDSEHVILSTVNPQDGSTQTITTLRNVAGITASDTATTASEKVANLLVRTEGLSTLASLNDLKTISEAGMSFKGNTGETVTRALGSTLSVQGEGTYQGGFAQDNLIVEKTAEDTLTVKLAKNLQGLTSADSQKLTLGAGDATITLTEDDSGALKLSGQDGASVKITNIASDDQNPNSAVTYKVLSELEQQIGTGTTASQDNTSPAGKDGLDGSLTLADQLSALRNGLAGSVIYTNEAGERLVKVGDKYYIASTVTDTDDLTNATSVAKDKIVLSLVNATGETTTVTPLLNLASGLGINSSTALSADEAKKAVVGTTMNGQITGGLLHLSGQALNQAATVADLQALAQAGFNYTGNHGQAHQALSQTLNIVGEGTYASNQTFESAVGNLNVLVKDHGLQVQLSDTLKNLDSVNANQMIVKNGENQVVLSQADGALKFSKGKTTDHAVPVVGVKTGSSHDAAVAYQEIKELIEYIGGQSNSAGDALSASGKDGLDGKTQGEQISALRNGLAGNVVYTDANGERLVKIGRDFYRTSDIDDSGAVKTGASAVRDDQIRLSLVNAKGETTDPAILANIASGLGLTGATDNSVSGDANRPQAIHHDAARQVIAGDQMDGTSGLLTATENLDRVATLGDLQAAAQAGFNFSGNASDVRSSRPVGTGLSIKGTGTATHTSDNNIFVEADETNSALLIKLAKDLKELTAAKFGSDQQKTELTANGVNITGQDDNGQAVTIILNEEGLDNGGQRIQHVASATVNTDGVTKQDVDSRIDPIENKVNELTPQVNQIVSDIQQIENNLNKGWTLGIAHADGNNSTISVNRDQPNLTLKAGDGIQLTQKDQTVTITTDNQALQNIAVSQGNFPAMYVDREGNKLYRMKDGSFNTQADGSGVTITANDVQVALEGTDGRKQLGQVASALVGSKHTEPITTEEAINAVNTLLKDTEHQQSAATVADLQALVQSGFEFVTNKGTVRKHLGETVTIKGTDHPLHPDRFSEENIVTTMEDDGTILIMIKKSTQNDSISASTSVTVGPKDSDGQPQKGTVQIVHDAGQGTGTISIRGEDGQDGKDAVLIASDSDGNGNMVIRGKDNVTTTVTGDGIVISPSKASPDLTVSLTNEGLNNGGNRIQNIAPGINPNDAANVGQLKGMISSMDKRLSRINKDSQAGIASVAAVASLQDVYLPGTTILAVGGATYKGNKAAAFGISGISETGRYGYKATATINNKGLTGGAVSGFYTWKHE